MADYEIAVAVIVSVVLAMVCWAAVATPQKYWPIKLGFFFGAFGVGWAALNVAVSMATQAGASSDLQKSIENVYSAYTVLTAALLLILFVWLMFNIAFGGMLKVAESMNRKNTSGIGDDHWQE